MKDIVISVALLSPFIICASGAVYLAANGLPGWGWFLAVAAIASFFSYKTGSGK